MQVYKSIRNFTSNLKIKIMKGQVYELKELDKIIKEIEEFTKTVSYKDVANEYTIERLKCEYSNLLFDYKILQSKLRQFELNEEINQLNK